jgi:hypothetical protein
MGGTLAAFNTHSGNTALAISYWSPSHPSGKILARRGAASGIQQQSVFGWSLAAIYQDGWVIAFQSSRPPMTPDS